MAQKITPKNLSYDSTLPPFLQRLHNTSTSSSASLDGRHERAIARPRRPRDPYADQEDEPVFVDEETGEVVSAEEVKALGAGDSAGGATTVASVGEQVEASGIEGEMAGKNGKEETAREKESDKQGAVIGVSRKRKAAKVVGGDGSEDEDIKATRGSGKGKIVARAKDGGAMDRKAKPVDGKAKAKSKKVKLSFGDDEEG